MGNVWNLSNEINCDELTGDEIYQKIKHKLSNTDTEKENIIICCSHPKLTCQQEDALKDYQDYCNIKFRKNYIANGGEIFPFHPTKGFL